MNIQTIHYKSTLVFCMLFPLIAYGNALPVGGTGFFFRETKLFHLEKIQPEQPAEKSGELTLQNNRPSENAIISGFKINTGAVIYLYIAFIGTFIGLIINLKKNSDKAANLLLSLFIFLCSFCLLYHALRIIHPNRSEYDFSIVTLFSFLYGPILYFYVKRFSQGYSFRWADILHLLPAVICSFYLLGLYRWKTAKAQPIFDWSGKELAAVFFITLPSFLSLSIYGYRIWKINTASKTTIMGKNAGISMWQRNLCMGYSGYVVLYTLHGLAWGYVTIQPLLQHLQLIPLVLLIIYIGYTAYTNPDKMYASQFLSYKNGTFIKYKKSALTDSYSKELKENLLKLLNEEKIFKACDITLEALSEKLHTTRHNASQVINEHFKMNFFELINKYRIEEAMDILKKDAKKKLNIIDIAYEVGFNNKVTFNKSFKKETSLTPTQYVEKLFYKDKTEKKEAIKR